MTRAVRFAEARLHRSSNLELQVVLPEDLLLESTEAMREVEQLTAFLGATPGLGTPFSVLDLISRLNRLVHDDDPRFERGAASAAGNAELLELLAFDDPEVLEAWVSLDRSRLRISVDAESLPHSDNVEILDRVKHYLRTALPPGWRVLESGAFAADVEWVRDVQATQLRSFPVAFALVLALVAVFLRSLRLALLAMVPTLLPVLIVLGAMGWGGMHIDVARAMFASVMIGIAVDDSIHMLCHYRLRCSLGDSPSAAIESAMLHTGHAIATTSLALALGFATFTASAWQSVASFGLLMSGGILLALAATLIVLPALIFVFAQERE